MSTDDLFAFSASTATLGSIFRPHSPTNNQKLFRGRRQQLSRLVTVTAATGQHAIIFGERGVGKTSLSYMVRDTFESMAPDGTLCVRITCTASDDFGTLWAKLPGRIRLELSKRHQDLDATLDELVDSNFLDEMEDRFLDTPTPDLVAQELTRLSARVRLLVLIDELDRMNVFDAGPPLADLVKQISDDIVPCTIILVGVADNVSDLIAGHASVDRCLSPVAMPRMSQEELREIVREGFAEYSRISEHPITISDNAVSAIANLSQGFPYFTHLLASAVGRQAIEHSRDAIEFIAVFEALMTAKDEAEPSIRESYYNATVAARSGATFEETLIACAMCSPDQMGYFTASDVCAPLADILGVPSRRNSDFNAHLKRFSTEHPIVLECKTAGNSKRYRFANPLMKPFAIMCGLTSGKLNAGIFETIE